MLAHRVRKAALRGATIGFVNPEDYALTFKRAAYVAAPLGGFVRALAGVVAAAAELSGRPLPPAVAGALEGVSGTAADAAAVRVLMGKKRTLVLLGHIAQRHPRFADIRALAGALTELTGAKLGYLPEGANGVGAALVGLVPGREAFNSTSMLTSPRHAYILFGVEPDQDFAEGALAEQALEAADVVVAFTSFVGESLRKCADVLLPIAAFAETPGTFVNAEGRWQSFTAAAEPVGEARPGWRVLRVLGNALGVPDFEYRSAEEVRDEIRARVGAVTPDNSYRGSVEISFDEQRVDPAGIDVPMYAIDPLVRRSEPLQQTVQARSP